MLSRFLLRLAAPPRVSRRDILLTVIPAVLWAALVFSRPVLIHTRCAAEPQTCTPQSVLAIDRVALGLENGDADGYSYWTQNASGILAGTVPAIWTVTARILGRIHPATAWASIGADLLIFVQATAWNGMINEAVRVSTQRPRPFVYSDPARLGAMPAHYISFYSGHTSYSAAMMVTLLLILLSRGAPLWVLGTFLALGQGLVISTAVFRVLAGRHFVTDVVVAAIMGTLVAITVALAHRPREKDLAP